LIIFPTVALISWSGDDLQEAILTRSLCEILVLFYLERVWEVLNPQEENNDEGYDDEEEKAARNIPEQERRLLEQASAAHRAPYENDRYMLMIPSVILRLAMRW
jgi:hypothetical protein